MFQHSSLIAILLIVVHVLSTPDAVAAQSRKLRKDGGNDGRRVLQSKKEDKACYKSSKDGCLGIVLSKIKIQQESVDDNKYFGISYGSKRDNKEGCNNNGNNCDGWDNQEDRVVTKPTAIGTVWIGYGDIGYVDDNGNTLYDDENSFFVQKCTVLRGKINKNSGKFEYKDEKVPLMCDLFLHVGEGYTGFQDFDDTIHLRGYTKGRINAKEDTNNAALEELYKVGDFWASVIGGTGRWAGSIGVAKVFTEGAPGEDLDDDDIGWLLDLYATVSPAYDAMFKEVPLPPPLKLAPSFDYLP